MAIRIIAIGKKHEPWIEDGLQRYQKRLQQPFDVLWVLLPHSALEGPAARQEESRRILDRIATQDAAILLDERGKMLDSPAISRIFEEQFGRSRSVVLVIGGAYGVDDTVHARADLVWSLSPLVFPHQLVRLIVAEQLYRAQCIAGGHPYHHQ